MRKAVDELRQCFSDVPDDELNREIEKAREAVRAEMNERIARSSMQRRRSYRSVSRKSSTPKKRTPQPA